MHSVQRPSMPAPRLRTAALAVVLGLGLLAAVPDAATSRGQTPRPGDRGMFVSVLNKDGVPVTDLGPRDFIVREDGMQREVLTAEKATDPVTVALVVDTSQASRPYMADMRRALKTFVAKFGGKNPIAITTFGERPTVLLNYTLDVPSLDQAVGLLFARSGSGSYLLQAVGDVCKGLEKRDFERGVILAITAGGPEFSESNYTESLPKLRASGAMLNVMTFSLDSPDLSDSGQRNRELFVDAATRATGGDRTLLLTSMALESALDKLVNELSNQYRITYARPEKLIPPEKIEVGVVRPGLTARGTPVKAKRG
jgi:Ca-activated chloride channel homolog